MNWKEPSTWAMVGIGAMIAVGIPLSILDGGKEKPAEPKATTIADPAAVSPPPKEKQCALLLGNLGDIQPPEPLYTDPSCTKQIGLIMGVSSDGSQVAVRRNSDGQLEWVERGLVTHVGHIKR